jgi:prepilin-type N-terminal cleavage/methylation domain-containing protein
MTARKKFDEKFTDLRSRKGFTLIEVMFVIAIMAILSSFILAAVSQIQKNSRDFKRKSDLAAVAGALQRFYNENGHYPSSSSGKIQVDTNSCANVGAGITLDWGTDNFHCLVVVNGNTFDRSYLKVLPEDPFPSRSPYCYQSSSPYLNYTLAAKLENTSDKDLEGSVFTCNGTSGYNYKVVLNK